jgi:hypothetical protein
VSENTNKILAIRRPSRGEYETEADYIYACGAQAREAQNRMLRAMDLLSIPDNSTSIPDKSLSRACGAGLGTLKAWERDLLKKPTLHDYLAERPALRARYLDIGPAALME